MNTEVEDFEVNETYVHTEGHVEIVPVQSCPEVIPKLLEWYQKAFIVEYLDLEAEHETLVNSLDSPDALPFTLVGFVGNVPTATMRLCDSCLEERPQYDTWLDYTFSVPEVRDRGIIELMLQYMIEYCKILGRTELYAYLGSQQPRRMEALLRRGWEVVEYGGFDGHETGVIMKLRIPSAAHR